MNVAQPLIIIIKAVSPVIVQPDEGEKNQTGNKYPRDKGLNPD